MTDNDDRIIEVSEAGQGIGASQCSVCLHEATIQVRLGSRNMAQVVRLCNRCKLELQHELFTEGNFPT